MVSPPPPDLKLWATSAGDDGGTPPQPVSFLSIGSFLGR
eukprot:CAMPEP_0114042746 /NCGR_PEP_ID=MMETSP1339-20121228/5993_1 /TAXON_ID=94617 /ORGANISM="Fibrocapsa japonica" /LENGTH=38 /assembly_acc=CAM_ASM_000762